MQEGRLPVTRREFRLDKEYRYHRSGPVRWIVSHLLRYPVFPLLAVGFTILNNTFYSNIQVYVGRSFDVINTPGWSPDALLALAATMMLFAAGQGLTGLGRNYAMEFLAQHIERDSRDELYVSLLANTHTLIGGTPRGKNWPRPTTEGQF